MKAKHLPVTYVLYPDEGHGFARPQNRISFYAVAEGFLAQCLGGRTQPIGEDFAGSSLKVPVGCRLRSRPRRGAAQARSFAAGAAAPRDRATDKRH